MPSFTSTGGEWRYRVLSVHMVVDNWIISQYIYIKNKNLHFYFVFFQFPVASASSSGLVYLRIFGI